MKKRVLSILLVVTMAAAMLAGCGKESKEANSTDTSEEKVLRWNVGAEPTCIDPMIVGKESMQIVNNTFEGLMRTLNGEQVCAMAESYEVSDDALTYTFHLRDAKWSDGEPVKAEDFAYAWFRMIDPKLQNSYGYQFFCIKGAQDYFAGEASKEDVGIKVVDDKTLEVELNTPAPYFLALTAYNVFYPVREDVADPEGKWSMDPETAICNGPFVLEEYAMNEKMVLARNENYWDAENVKLDKIEISFIIDADSAMTAFRAGDIDLFKEVPPQEIPQLQADDPEFYTLPMMGISYYAFNLQREPLNDVRVRKAMSMAIDRTTLAENVLKDGSIPGTGTVPHGIPLSTGEEFREAAKDYDCADPTQAKVEEAQALLAEAGFPNGEGFPTLSLMVTNKGSRVSLAEAVTQMWKENLGITIEVQVVEPQVMSQSHADRNFDITHGGWSADYTDAYNFLSLWYTGSDYNYGYWSNAEFDKLIDDSMYATGEERDQMLLDAEEILIEEDCAGIMVHELADTCMINERVVNWDKTGFAGWYFGYTDIKK